MAKVRVFKIDEYGYPRFTSSADWQTMEEAVIEQRVFFAGVKTEILTYSEYKARQDPDTMPERELAVRLGKTYTAPISKGVVITGRIEGLTREEAELAMIARGYKPQSEITSKTAFLIAGDSPSSAKMMLAEVLDLPVKTWDEGRAA